MARAGEAAPPSSRKPTTLHDIPDKLLRLILQLLLVSPIWVVRAAATCRRWRRLVAHRGFECNSLTSHYARPEHVVAGSYHNRRGRDLVFVPDSSPPAVVDSRHFSLDFLPGGGGAWVLLDSCSSVLLLAKKKGSGWRRCCFPDLLVCEPIQALFRCQGTKLPGKQI